jgi:hypothetical protein
MADYPVMFTVRDTVSGSGFLAGVTLTGRAIMTQEDGKWWVLGVRPPIAESGEMPQEAFLRFRNSYKNVLLFDFAESSEKYENFREAVEAFYHQAEREEEDRWSKAFRALRSGDVKADAPFFCTLPKEDRTKRPTQIAVERLKKPLARPLPTT